MTASAVNNAPKKAYLPGQGPDYRTYFFSELANRRVCAGKIKDKLGRLTDLVFRLAEPYPEAVGLYLNHGWGKPTEFIPLEKVVKIDEDAIFVQPPPAGDRYPPFANQSGWFLAGEQLMGRTILDMDGRTVEVVNDVHLLESKGRMVLIHVDVSFNGFLRKWHLGWLRWVKDRLISWKYVQPITVETQAGKDSVSLSITRRQIGELPSEDLADALEELTGEEQQAVFSALDSEKAAETLMEAEPRARRQLIASLRQERARNILSEMSVAQLADLFSVLPHDDKTDLMTLLPREQAERVAAILSEKEASARALMTAHFTAMTRETKAREALQQLRSTRPDPDDISYIYIVAEPEKTLAGVVDLRDLILAPDEQTLGDLMAAPVVSAEEDDLREDLAELFAKYHYRTLPVVDPKDHLLGIIHHRDVMKGAVPRTMI
jgi:CBS domain-containing protein